MPILQNYDDSGLVFSAITNSGYYNPTITSNINFTDDKTCNLSVESSTGNIEIIWDLGNYGIFPDTYIMKPCNDRRIITEWKLFGRKNEQDKWSIIDHRKDFEMLKFHFSGKKVHFHQFYSK